MSSGSSGPSPRTSSAPLDDLGLAPPWSSARALSVEQALHHAADFQAHPILRYGSDALQIPTRRLITVNLRLQLEVVSVEKCAAPEPR